MPETPKPTESAKELDVLLRQLEAEMAHEAIPERLRVLAQQLEAAVKKRMSLDDECGR